MIKAYLVTDLNGKLRDPIYNNIELIINPGLEINIPTYLNGSDYFSNGVVRLYTNSIVAMLSSTDNRLINSIRIFVTEADVIAQDTLKPWCVAAKVVKVLEEIDLPLTANGFNIVILNVAHALADKYSEESSAAFKEWITFAKKELLSNNILNAPTIKPSSSEALIYWCFEIIYNKDYSNTAALIRLGNTLDLIKITKHTE